MSARWWRRRRFLPDHKSRDFVARQYEGHFASSVVAVSTHLQCDTIAAIDHAKTHQVEVRLLTDVIGLVPAGGSSMSIEGTPPIAEVRVLCERGNPSVLYVLRNASETRKIALFESQNPCHNLHSTCSFVSPLYAHQLVSTRAQPLELQPGALKVAGRVQVFTDIVSGVTSDRPGLAKAVEYARDGDTIVVWHLDRLVRSLKHFIETIGRLRRVALSSNR